MTETNEPSGSNHSKLGNQQCVNSWKLGKNTNKQTVSLVVGYVVVKMLLGSPVSQTWDVVLGLSPASVIQFQFAVKYTLGDSLDGSKELGPCHPSTRPNRVPGSWL